MRAIAQENKRMSSTIMSICPSHVENELKFVIGIETQTESLDYVIDMRSAILLAFGLDLIYTISYNLYQDHFRG